VYWKILKHKWRKQKTKRNNLLFSVIKKSHAICVAFFIITFNPNNIKHNYKMVHKCDLIFCQEDKKNCCISIIPNVIIKWSKDAYLFFIYIIQKIVAYQIDTEGFFDAILVKKKKQIGLFCSYVWY